MSTPPYHTHTDIPVTSSTVTSTMDPTNAAPVLSSGATLADGSVAGSPAVDVPLDDGSLGPGLGGFDCGGSTAAETIVDGINIPQVGHRTGRPGLSLENYSRVGMMNMPVKMDNVPKMKGNFDSYAVQLRTFLTRMSCWAVVEGTFAYWDPKLQGSFAMKDNIAREAILSGVSADDAEMICQEDTTHAM